MGPVAAARRDWREAVAVQVRHAATPPKTEDEVFREAVAADLPVEATAKARTKAESSVAAYRRTSEILAARVDRTYELLRDAVRDNADGMVEHIVDHGNEVVAEITDAVHRLGGLDLTDPVAALTAPEGARVALQALHQHLVPSYDALRRCLAYAYDAELPVTRPTRDVSGSEDFGSCHGTIREGWCQAFPEWRGLTWMPAAIPAWGRYAKDQSLHRLVWLIMGGWTVWFASAQARDEAFMAVPKHREQIADHERSQRLAAGVHAWGG